MKLPFTIDRFLLSLVLVVVAACIWPAPGVSGGFLHMEAASTYGISIVFFLYGLTLEPQKMRAGIMRWPVHIVVQVSTFVVFPAIVFAATRPLSGSAPPAVLLGFLYLAALPSTVSSSVAMTSLARGSVPVALFNATLSSLLGVFLTPVIMAYFIQKSGGSIALGPVIAKVALLVLAPIICGQIARRWLAEWARRQARFIKFADRAVILMIVYGSFCDSVARGVWSSLSPVSIAMVALACIALFFVVYSLVLLPCRALGFDREERIACLFCASKKSLATGVPLAPVIFGSVTNLGILITPLMLYHFLQLVIVTIIATRYEKGYAASSSDAEGLRASAVTPLV